MVENNNEVSNKPKKKRKKKVTVPIRRSSILQQSTAVTTARRQSLITVNDNNRRSSNAGMVKSNKSLSQSNSTVDAEPKRSPSTRRASIKSEDEFSQFQDDIMSTINRRLSYHYEEDENVPSEARRESVNYNFDFDPMVRRSRSYRFSHKRPVDLF